MSQELRRGPVVRVRALAGRVLTGDFATEQQFVRHDADKVIQALWPHT